MAHLHVPRGWLIFADCHCVFFRYVADNHDYVTPLANVCHRVLESLMIHSCSCAPVCRQLMQQGLFPCSPLAPTLAVDLQVLEFITCLFVHIPPNNTGWCKTIEEFLDSQGYKLTTKVSSFIKYNVTLLKYHAGFSL
jgi:CxC1 like cysteine cluster associated with KDZ transposases